MIRVHLADRGTTTFSGDFAAAYAAAQSHIRDHASPSAEKADDDRPEGVSEKDWRFTARRRRRGLSVFWRRPAVRC